MKGAIREIIIVAILVLVLFIAIHNVVQTSVVNGISMEPNLHTGQRIIVSKAAYWFTGPHRGDIVVFHSSRVNGDIIHRVVGLPSELVEIRNGDLYINGEKREESYLPQAHYTSIPPQKIPDDNYFIIGDNRGVASWDIVPRDEIIGKAWLCYWPLSNWGRVSN